MAMHKKRPRWYRSPWFLIKGGRSQRRPQTLTDILTEILVVEVATHASASGSGVVFGFWFVSDDTLGS
ncbi:hypothetical protein N39L_01100 [Limnospira platensis NIES-39]|uniref:Transposase n=1 Tax=Limnospira platensis NIES-46 TaxID=1236695 RepID=A0A5M3T940_LIMPL|nr:hypothetical protein N39L_01100 [Arthrospira platensis NIES-39]GCE94518.1 hypothetical protein NIES46_25760 [Arthrospira platensis NIES-46]